MSNEELSFDDLEPEGGGNDTPEDSARRTGFEPDYQRDDLGEYQFGWPEEQEAMFEAWEDNDEFSGNGHRKRTYSRKRSPMANRAARTARKWGSTASTTTVMLGWERPQAGSDRVRRPSGRDSFEYDDLDALNDILPGDDMINGQEAPMSSAALIEAYELMDRLATAASKARDGVEATGLVAAAVPLVIALHPGAYRALWPAMPALIKGAMGVTKLLRSRPETRPLLSLMPVILRSAAAKLARYASDDGPISNQLAAKVLAQCTAVALRRSRGDRDPYRRIGDKGRKRANYSRSDDDWWDEDYGL